LNKQHSKKEYEELIEKIKRHMDEMPYVDKKGRIYKFGEFFPTQLSAYAYNETFGFPWYPKSKEEVLAEGWRWQDPPVRSYEITMPPENLPDHVKDAPDSISEEIIGCAHCGTCNEQCTTAFRITSRELAFYRKMNIALPRFCPNCRSAQRLQWRNSFTLYHRKCMCGNAGHFHAAAACPNEFETTFSPDKPETIYCAECYKAEYL
jgi:ferredoxin